MKTPLPGSLGQRVRLPVLLLLLVSATIGFSTQMSVGDQVVNSTEVTLDIVHKGESVGSTKIPVGRNLTVLEITKDAIKVSASPILSGWVDPEAVESKAAPPAPESGISATESAVGPPDANTRPSGTGRQAARAMASRVVIAEEKTTKTIVAEPPSKCRGIEHGFSFQPTVTRGEDLADKSAVLRFYLVVLRENEEKTKANPANRRIRIDGESFNVQKKAYEPSVCQLKDVSIPVADEKLKPFRHGYMEGKCSCCRDLKDGELLGWYAELFDGEKVLHKAQSSMNSAALSALHEHLAERPE